MEHLEFFHVLGRGQFGVAWLAKYKRSGYHVVVKKIPFSGASEKEIDSIKKEVSLLQELRHPYITGFIESFEGMDTHSGEKMFCISMEYCDAGTLYDQIEDKKKVSESFTEERILSWLAQIASGVQYMHSNYVLHRDLKPQNIFLSTSEHVIKIGDFGLAKKLTSEENFTKTVVGTPYYLSPEVCSWKPYNEKCDVWAVGCITYEICSLQYAFKAENMPLLVRRILREQPRPITSISRDLWGIVEKMLVKKPDERPHISDICNHSMLSSYISDMSNIPTPELSASFHKNCDSSASSQTNETICVDSESSFSAPEFGVLQIWGRGQNIPRVEALTSSYKMASFGEKMNAAITDDGVLLTWGEGMACGHGFNYRTPRPLPVIALAGIKIVYVSCGKDHTVALTDEGHVYAWGKGAFGKLGHGDFEDQEIPRKLDLFEGVRVKQAACGNDFTLFLTDDGRVFSCGRDEYFLGYAADDSVTIPSLVEGFDGQISYIACGSTYAFAISDADNVYSWGSGEYGVLGHNGEDDSLPEVVESLSGIGIYQIACGDKHALGLTREGRVYGWGLSTYAGTAVAKRGSTKLVPTITQPEEVRSLGHREIQQIACGASHSIALTDDSLVYSWGDNIAGQLGHGSFETNYKPVTIDLLLKKKIIKIVAQFDRSAVIFE